MTNQEIIKYKVMKLFMNPEAIVEFIESLLADKQGTLDTTTLEMKTDLEEQKVKSEAAVAEVEVKLLRINK